MKFFSVILSSLLLSVYAGRNSAPPVPAKKCCIEEFKEKFTFSSFVRGTVTAGWLLDSMNGAAFLIKPAGALALSGLPSTPRSVTDILGVAFLGSAAGRAFALTEGDEAALGRYCRNALVPLGALTATLLAVPLKAADPKVHSYSMLGSLQVTLGDPFLTIPLSPNKLSTFHMIPHFHRWLYRLWLHLWSPLLLCWQPTDAHGASRRRRQVRRRRKPPTRVIALLRLFSRPLLISLLVSLYNPVLHSPTLFLSRPNSFSMMTPVVV